MEMHLSYFSQRTLQQMVEKAGYVAVHSSPQGRYTRLGYLVTRIRALSRPASWLAQLAVKAFRLSEIAVPINLGDLFTLYARK
jgi:hypothetical protein